MATERVDDRQRILHRLPYLRDRLPQRVGLPLGQWGIKLLEMGPWRKEDGTWEGKYVPVPTTSCDLCEGRVAEGGVPSCVLHCL